MASPTLRLIGAPRPCLPQRFLARVVTLLGERAAIIAHGGAIGVAPRHRCNHRDTRGLGWGDTRGLGWALGLIMGTRKREPRDTAMANDLKLFAMICCNSSSSSRSITP